MYRPQQMNCEYSSGAARLEVPNPRYIRCAESVWPIKKPRMGYAYNRGQRQQHGINEGMNKVDRYRVWVCQRASATESRDWYLI